MAGYEKFTLKSFQKKLADGDYKDLGGCNRAIGRMSTFSEKDREKARELARAHFGEGSAAPKKTKAKKVSATKAPKAGKKAAKKVSATKGKARTKAAAPKAPKAAKQSPAKKAARGGPPTRQSPDRIETANRIGESIHRKLESLELTRRLGAPSEEVAEGAKRAQKALTQVIDALGSSVASLLGEMSDEEKRGAAAFEKAARAATAGGNGLRPPAAAAPPVPPVIPPNPQPEQA